MNNSPNINHNLLAKEIVVATFKDAQHIYSFMAETLASIPGILEFEFVPLGKMVKYSSSFIDSE